MIDAIESHLGHRHMRYGDECPGTSLPCSLRLQSLPHNGAGASQAVEDAYVLGELLKSPECTADTLPQFLQAYEDARRERASHQQIHSRESGEESLI
jgi:hypothetical protein